MGKSRTIWIEAEPTSTTGMEGVEGPSCIEGEPEEYYSEERIFGVLSIITALLSPIIGVTLAIISFKRNENPTNGIIGIMVALANAVIGYFLMMDLVRQLGGI